MCTVSMISEYGRDRFPMHYWDSTTWPPFKELIDHAKKVDEQLEQPDCEDPAKTEWMKQVEERITQLEAKKRKKVKAHAP